jgi:hypothetical protein
LSVNAFRLAGALTGTARRKGKLRVEVVFDGRELRVQSCDGDPDAIAIPFVPRRVKL